MMIKINSATVILSLSILLYAEEASSQVNDFESWDNFGGFDPDFSGDHSKGNDALPSLSIPEPPSSITTPSAADKGTATPPDVPEPKNVPLIDIPQPAAEPEDKGVSFPAPTGGSGGGVGTAPKAEVKEEVEIPKAAKSVAKKVRKVSPPKKSKAKPVEFKKDENEQPKSLNRMPGDEGLSSSVSSILQENEILEDSYDPRDGETRRKFDYHEMPKKFFLKDNLGEQNKHLPKPVYQKRYSELLFAAIQKDDIGAISTLLNHGADINSRFVENGYSALMYSIQTRNMRSVRYLITKGADFNLKGDDGKTALHLAALGGNVEVFSMLLESGAKPFETDFTGNTALDYVAEPLRNQFELIVARNQADFTSALFYFVDKGRATAVSSLIDHGAQINVRNAKGDTPLMVATRNNDEAMVSLLLSKGASTLPVNNHGEHALGIAQRSGFMELAKIIDTMNIKRDLESGRESTKIKMLQPTPVQATLNAPANSNEQNLIQAVDNKQIKSEEDLKKEEMKKSMRQNIVKRGSAPKQDEESEGFFSSILESISSIGDPVADNSKGASNASPKSDTISSSGITEVELPKIEQKSLGTIESVKPQEEVIYKKNIVESRELVRPDESSKALSSKSRLPAGVVKKKVIKQAEVSSEATPENESFFNPMSLLPGFSD